MDRRFCRSRSTFHRYGRIAVTLCLLLTLCTTLATAQSGRRGRGFSGGSFSRGDFLQRMDRNENGRLDEDEIPGPFRDVLESQGLDISRGVSFEDFEEARESLRSQFREGGLRRFGGADEDDGRRGDDGRDRGMRDDDAESEGSSERSPRPRATFDLPVSHAAADTDGDGQLGMYEWRRWSGHSLREFLDLDGNGDGFVTPREVYLVIGFPQQDEDADEGSDGGQGVAARPGGESSASTPVAESAERLTDEAERYFRILDKDNDGVLTEEEWGSSVRIRGMFEKGGLDLSEPMSEELFVQTYVRLSDAG